MSHSSHAAPLLCTLLITLTTLFVIITSVIYIFLKKQYRFWKKHGVPGPQPKILVGNMAELVQLKMTEPQLFDIFYKQYSTEKYIGIYSLWRPALLVRDQEIAKRIFENDFEHFTDHPDLRGHVQSDSIVYSLFTMKGNKWKSRRALFARLFTPKKLKQYFDDMQGSLLLFLNVLDEKLNQDIEISSHLDRHFVRVICLMLYGLDISKDDERIDKFINSSDIFSKPPVSTTLMFLFFMVAPKLFKFLKVRIYPLSIWKFFSKFSEEVISAKKLTRENKNDLLELVINLGEEKIIDGEKINFEETVGHLFGFFIGSYQTTKVTVGHTILLLASYPEAQEKLRHEIDSVRKGSQITYEHLSQMEYLEAVLMETLRMYPILGDIKRICTKTYKLDDKFTVPEGMVVYVPVQSIQMDPEIYFEPEKFKPDRFYNKESSSAALMSFGKGPRACIGTSLGKLSAKLIIARLLSEYVILPSEKMILKFDARCLFTTMRPVGGFWIKLKKRDH